MGGLILSQILTLYTTPVVYLILDRLGMRMRGGPLRALPRDARLNEDRVERNT